MSSRASERAQWAAAVVDAADGVASWLARHGVDAPEVPVVMLRALVSEELPVSVFGNHSSGKSTLLNGLMGLGALPEAAIRTTAVTTMVRWSSQPRAVVRFVSRRDVGPFDHREPEVQRDSLRAVLELLEDPDSALQEVVSVASGLMTPVSRRVLQTRLDLLGKDAHAPPSPWTTLRLVFAPREPLALSLDANDTDGVQATMKPWVAGGARSLAVGKAELGLPLEPLRGRMLLDTPGIDALSEEHRRIARSTLEPAAVVLFVFDGNHASASESSRQALEHLHTWLDDRARTVLYVATRADDAVESRVFDSEDEGEPQTEAEAFMTVRQGIVDGLAETLHLVRHALASRGGGASTVWDPDDLFVVDCHDLRGWDGVRLRQRVSGLRWTGAIESRMHAGVLGRVDALLSSARAHLDETVARHRAADDEATKRLGGARLLQKRWTRALKRLRKGRRERLEKGLAALRRWIEGSLQSAADLEKLRAKWARTAERLAQRDLRCLCDVMEGITDEAEEQGITVDGFVPGDIPRVRLTKLGPAEADLKRWLWPRRYRKQARAVVLERLGAATSSVQAQLQVVDERADHTVRDALDAAVSDAEQCVDARRKQRSAEDAAVGELRDLVEALAAARKDLAGWT